MCPRRPRPAALTSGRSSRPLAPAPCCWAALSCPLLSLCVRWQARPASAHRGPGCSIPAGAPVADDICCDVRRTPDPRRSPGDGAPLPGALTAVGPPPPRWSALRRLAVWPLRPVPRLRRHRRLRARPPPPPSPLGLLGGALPPAGRSRALAPGGWASAPARLGMPPPAARRGSWLAPRARPPASPLCPSALAAAPCPPRRLPLPPAVGLPAPAR